MSINEWYKYSDSMKVILEQPSLKLKKDLIIFSIFYYYLVFDKS